MEIFLIIVLFVLLGVACYTTYIQYNRANTAENYLNRTYILFKEAYMEMKRIDRIGAFESDDEVGFVFERIKEIILIVEDELQDESQENNTQQKK